MFFAYIFAAIPITIGILTILVPKKCIKLFREANKHNTFCHFFGDDKHWHSRSAFTIFFGIVWILAGIFIIVMSTLMNQ